MKYSLNEISNLAQILMKHEFQGIENQVSKLHNSLASAVLNSKEKHLIYGQRTENMFSYIVDALGKALLIKKEDSGAPIINTKSLKIPDYRIILPDKSPLLIEVKNVFSKNHNPSIKIKPSYAKKLSEYSQINKSDLKFAIFWKGYSQWTLNSISDFLTINNKLELKFADAIAKNEMRILGDFLIGTVPPLKIHIYFSTKYDLEKLVEGQNEIVMTLRHLEYYSGERKLNSKKDTILARIFCMFGNWTQDEPQMIIIDKHHGYHEWEFRPIEVGPHGFSIVSSFSGLISSWFNQLTAPSGKVEKLIPHQPLGKNFELVKDHNGDDLKLWRFFVQPNKNHH